MVLGRPGCDVTAKHSFWDGHVYPLGTGGSARDWGKGKGRFFGVISGILEAACCLDVPQLVVTQVALYLPLFIELDPLFPFPCPCRSYLTDPCIYTILPGTKIRSMYEVHRHQSHIRTANPGFLPAEWR